MKGYKAFKKGWICQDMQYEIGKSYEMEEEPIMCERGYHFCANPIDVFGYYNMDDDTVIAEVEAYGKIKQEGTKFCTNRIKIVKEFTRKQLQELILDGNYNTGEYSSGNYNSGHYNSGNHNSGQHNSGSYNSGSYNSGSYNYGDENSGNYNCGNNNSGYYNSNDYNTGDCNSGKRNSGDYNSGNFNTGRCNSGNYNSGIFNTDEPKMRAFNKEAEMSYTNFIKGLNYSFHSLCDRIYRKAFIDGDWDKIEALPNYDAEIFYQITGLRKEKIMPETNSNIINFFDWLENKFKKEFVEPLKEEKKCDIISIKDYRKR